MEADAKCIALILQQAGDFVDEDNLEDIAQELLSSFGSWEAALVALTSGAIKVEKAFDA